MNTSLIPILSPTSDAPGKPDNIAFAALYRQHAPAVYRYAYHRLGRHEDAQDATGQTFVQAWAAFGRFHDRGVPVQAWLYRVAANVVVDMQRRDKVRAALPLDANDCLWDSLVDPGLSPSEIAERNERYRKLQAMIHGLSPDYRKVVALRYVLGLRAAEIARLMGRSEGAVKLLLHRAVRAMREQMQEQEGKGWA